MKTQRTHSANSGRYAGNVIEAVHAQCTPGECICHRAVIQLYLKTLRTGDRLLARNILLLLIRVPDRIVLN